MEFVHQKELERQAAEYRRWEEQLLQEEMARGDHRKTATATHHLSGGLCTDLYDIDLIVLFAYGQYNVDLLTSSARSEPSDPTPPSAAASHASDAGSLGGDDPLTSPAGAHGLPEHRSRSRATRTRQGTGLGPNLRDADPPPRHQGKGMKGKGSAPRDREPVRDNTDGTDKKGKGAEGEADNRDMPSPKKRDPGKNKGKDGGKGSDKSYQKWEG